MDRPNRRPAVDRVHICSYFQLKVTLLLMRLVAVYYAMRQHTEIPEIIQ